MKKFRSDLAAMIALVRDTKNDLLAPIPHGEGQTLLREALLVIDHNSYHVGQLVDVRRSLDAWPGNGTFLRPTLHRHTGSFWLRRRGWRGCPRHGFPPVGLKDIDLSLALAR